MPGPRTADGLHLSYVATWPDIEAPLTHFASPHKVMEHDFLEGFKPVNIESYDGTTDPAVWIEDFLLHIHMARGDDSHAIKYLPLKLKGPARYWLNSLRKILLAAGNIWKTPSVTTSKEHMSGHRMPMT